MDGILKKILSELQAIHEGQVRFESMQLQQSQDIKVLRKEVLEIKSELKKFMYNICRISLSIGIKVKGEVAMLIKSSSALRNDYDNLVKLSHEQQEPIYITRKGEGEMVFLPIVVYEKREAELKLLETLLTAERNRLAGAPSYSTDDLRSELKEIYYGKV